MLAGDRRRGTRPAGRVAGESHGDSRGHGASGGAGLPPGGPGDRPARLGEAPQRRLGGQDALRAASGAAACHMRRARFPAMDAGGAAHDQRAQGGVHAAGTAGLQGLPDRGGAGCDDIPEAAYFIPPLTTVRQEPALRGSTAVRIRARRVDARHETGRITALESVSLQPDVVLHCSSIPDDPVRRGRARSPL